MQPNRYAKFLMLMATSSGLLFGSPNCIPSRTQFIGMINSGLINGVQLALTLAVQEALTPVLTPGEGA